MAKLNEDTITRNMLSKIRGINNTSYAQLNEETTTKKKGIAITDEPFFGERVLSSQIEQFRSSVDSGAEFTKPSQDEVATSPLIFLPDTKNMVFSGTIPSLGNLKFQMVLRTSSGDGLFLWSEEMILNENNLKTLTKLYGFYKNWKESWFSEAGDLERLAQNLQK